MGNLPYKTIASSCGTLLPQDSPCFLKALPNRAKFLFKIRELVEKELMGWLSHRFGYSSSHWLCTNRRAPWRGGMSEKPVSSSVLRDTYAVRYLQAGGQPEALLEQLGLYHLSSIISYQRLSKQLCEDQMRKEPPTDPCLH